MGIRGTHPDSELRAYRKRRKRSLAAQAALFGITGPALGRYERGLRTPRPEIQRRIFAVAGLTPNQLAGFSHKKKWPRAPGKSRGKSRGK